MSLPEAAFTFQITFPNGGFWGVGLKPWNERARTTFEILPEVREKVSAIPGIQTFPILPAALPGGGSFPVEFVIASTAEPSDVITSYSIHYTKLYEIQHGRYLAKQMVVC